MIFFFKAFLLGLIFAFLAIGSHVILSRYILKSRRIYFIQIIFIFFLPLLSLAIYFLPATTPIVQLDVTLTLLLALTVIYVIYLCFYSLVDHSVRIRLCIEINEAKHPLSYEDVLKVYNPDEAFLDRLGKMRDSHYVSQNKEGFQLTAKGLKLARVIKLFRGLYRITKE